MNAITLKSQQCLVMLGSSEAVVEDGYQAVVKGPVALGASDSVVLVKGEAFEPASISLQGGELGLLDVSGELKVSAASARIDLHLTAGRILKVFLEMDQKSVLHLIGPLDTLLLVSPTRTHQGANPLVTVFIEGEGLLVFPEEQEDSHLEPLQDQEIIDDTDELIRLVDHYEGLLQENEVPTKAADIVKKDLDSREKFLRDQYRKGRISLEELEKELL